MHIMHRFVKQADAHSAFDSKIKVMHDAHMDIARFRREKNWSQRDMAEKLDRDQSTIQLAEAMHGSAKLSTCLDYANVL
ncbi:MAG: helix-turn-helix transcriptional regulator, partial [Pseudooceanicola sp.]|nr:helix-turn-helix transcriptional regulator [Pseudooceanicola sp.]